MQPEDIKDAEVISKSIITKFDMMGISVSEGSVVNNTSNALAVLQTNKNFNNAIWFDEFHQKIFTSYDPYESNFGNIVREWDEEDNIRLSVFMQRELNMTKMSDEMVSKAIRIYAKKNIKNEPKDWMNELKWDQEPRIESFFINCAGAEDNEYTRAVSKNFWISIIARVFTPGCKVDTMPILEGGQGMFKSTLLQVIGGNLHCEASHDIKHKDFFQGLHGKLIIEFADLSSFSKTEVNLIKDILVRRSDHIRLPYAKLYKDFPRQSVFSGTTNNTTYLKDPTGARRFWPIKTGKINLELAKNTRKQLFAEAVFLFKDGQKWWDMPSRAEEEQEERREIDPWESLIYEYIYQRFETTTSDIMKNCLNFSNSNITRSEEIRVGNILRLFKWDRKQKRIGESRQYVYTPPALTGDIKNLPDEQLNVNWED